MTTPVSGQISVEDVAYEVVKSYSLYSAELGWLNTNLKNPVATPNMNEFHNKAYYARTQDGNCNNQFISNCNCNCGNVNCTACYNCEAINCANCDAREYLQANCPVATPTYNCTPNLNCFSYNCNCSKIICTKLYEYNLMSREVFEADQDYGTELIKNHPDVYNGYKAWAEIVVDWMEGKGPYMLYGMDPVKRNKISVDWATSWSYDIATPWAEEMAYIMGKKEKGSLTGKMLMYTGIPICKVVGVWLRWFGPSKKEAGFFKGLALIFIFILFKLVAETGRFIEKFLPNNIGAKQ
jgi:hypothetical protein